MPQISEYVQVDVDEKSVNFILDDAWIQVEDLDAWMAAFWDEVRDIAMEFQGCSSIIEREAFNRVT